MRLSKPFTHCHYRLCSGPRHAGAAAGLPPACLILLVLWFLCYDIFGPRHAGAAAGWVACLPDPSGSLVFLCYDIFGTRGTPERPRARTRGGEVPCAHRDRADAYPWRVPFPICQQKRPGLPDTPRRTGAVLREPERSIDPPAPRGGVEGLGFSQLTPLPHRRTGPPGGDPTRRGPTP